LLVPELGLTEHVLLLAAALSRRLLAMKYLRHLLVQVMEDGRVCLLPDCSLVAEEVLYALEADHEVPHEGLLAEEVHDGLLDLGPQLHQTLELALNLPCYLLLDHLVDLLVDFVS